jgi:hypothetical protein
LSCRAIALFLAVYASTAELTLAQSSPPDCSECEAFAPRYHPREIALVARHRLNAPLNLLKLWYLEDANVGLGVLSWNAVGIVVGTRFDPTGQSPRPFAWLPDAVPAWNLPAGIRDLLSIQLDQSTAETPGFAWDISDAGIVVGAANNFAETAGVRARAWNLSKSPTSCEFEIDLDPAPIAARPWSIALAIEPVSPNANEPRIFGVGGQQCLKWREPYRFELHLPACQGAPANAIELAPLTEPPVGLTPYILSAREWACDVTNFGLDPVGSFDMPVAPTATVAESCFSVLPLPNTCYLSMIAGARFQENGANFYRIGNIDSDRPSERTGIRSITAYAEQLQIRAKLAGYCWIPEESQLQSAPEICEQHAAIWDYETPFPPSAILPRVRLNPFGAAVELANPIGQRWRPIGCICDGEVVLGWDGAGNRGALWTKSRVTQEFVVYRGDELLAATPVQVQHYSNTTVEQMYDITPTGEILALVRRTYAQGDFDLHAAILGMRGDLNGDRVIDAADLAILLNAWGSSESIVADLDLNGLVDASDYSILGTQWMYPPDRLLLPADSVLSSAYCLLRVDEDCTQAPAMLGTPQPQLEARLQCAVQAFGFETAAQFVEWSQSAQSVEVEMACICVHASMQNMMEEPE